MHICHPLFRILFSSRHPTASSGYFLGRRKMTSSLSLLLITFIPHWIPVSDMLPMFRNWATLADHSIAVAVYSNDIKLVEAANDLHLDTVLLSNASVGTLVYGDLFSFATLKGNHFQYIGVMHPYMRWHPHALSRAIVCISQYADIDFISGRNLGSMSDSNNYFIWPNTLENNAIVHNFPPVPIWDPSIRHCIPCTDVSNILHPYVSSSVYANNAQSSLVHTRNACFHYEEPVNVIESGDCFN